ncbi:MAG: response regulator transcription factor [Rhodospirillales bacterium]
MISKSQTILIVEDDDVLREIVKKGLENATHSVLTASSGTEMFEVLARTPVNLILLDLGLPDGDALPHILKIRELTNAPLVILTARERIDDRLMALGLGADDYLTKPIDIRELVLRVNNILVRRADGDSAPGSAPNLAAARGRRSSDFEPRRRASDSAPRRRASDSSRDRRASDGPRRSGLLVLLGILGGITIAGAGAFWLSISSPEQVAQISVESAALEVGERSDQKDGSSESADAKSNGPVSTSDGEQQGELASDSSVSTTVVTGEPTRTALVVAETVTVTSQPTSQGSGTSVMVTAVPTTGQTDSTTAAIDAMSKAEVLGYAWALNSQCGPVPQVDWWKYRTHADIAEYVIRRHEGEWEPFIDDLVRRLAKMYDIAERKSAAVTPDGDRMEGEDLERYIEQSVARLQVVRCLSKEAELASAS